MCKQGEVLGSEAPEQPWLEMIALRDKVKSLKIEVKIQQEKYERADDAADRRLKHLKERPLSAKAGWTLPTKDCPTCGEPLMASAYDTGEGWLLQWECDKGCLETLLGEGRAGEDGMPEIDWPFDAEHAYWFDMEHVGLHFI